MALPYQLIHSRTALEEFSRSRAAGVPYDVPYHRRRILCRLLGDFPAFVDAGDLVIGPRLVLDGYWEPWVTLALARHIQPGMWCVDVGANYGYYTLLMAAAAGPEGRVLACEPHPLLAETYLPQNLLINALADRVEVRRLAIGDRDGQEIEFHLHAGNVGSSSLVRAADGRAGSSAGSCQAEQQTMCVQTATLDRLCADWPRLDLVKIDAEGAEALVWDGMQETLRRFPQAAVLVELHLEHSPPQAMSFLHQLERSGCGLRFVNYDGDVAPTDPATILASPHEHWMLWIQR